MKLTKNIPLLIDFDGVIRPGKKPAEDAKDFFEFLSNKKIPSCILSNSTLRNGNDIIKFLSDFNIEINIPAITCADAAVNFVKSNYKKVAVFAAESTIENLKEYLTEENPEAVIVGDISERWSYEIMNKIFRYVINGADFIAMQKNKFWSPDNENLYLDAGAFIKGIEFATGVEAKLIGKPSPLFYQSALREIGFRENSEFLMLGDDLETDIEAAQKIGGKAILIYTGKTSFPLDSKSKIKPDAEVFNLKELINLYN